MRSLLISSEPRIHFTRPFPPTKNKHEQFLNHRLIRCAILLLQAEFARNPKNNAFQLNKIVRALDKSIIAARNKREQVQEHFLINEPAFKQKHGDKGQSLIKNINESIGKYSMMLDSFIGNYISLKYEITELFKHN